MGLASAARALAATLAVVVVGACTSGDDPATPTTAPVSSTGAPTTAGTTTTLAAATTGPGTTAGPATTTAAATSRPTTTAGPTTTAACDPTGFGRATARSDAVPPAVVTLVDVDLGRHDCFERIVFTFRDGRPDYEVRVAEPPFVGIPGDPIPVAGASFLQVRFATTYMRYMNADGYDGPDAISPVGWAAIREVHLIEDFEAVVVWAIGLDAPRPFRVMALTGPDRIVIDVATTGAGV